LFSTLAWCVPAEEVGRTLVLELKQASHWNHFRAEDIILVKPNSIDKVDIEKVINPIYLIPNCEQSKYHKLERQFVATNFWSQDDRLL
jgi:hypothetical protein